MIGRESVGRGQPGYIAEINSGPRQLTAHYREMVGENENNDNNNNSRR